jgi:Flp pilus assembly protein TadG
VTERKRDRGAAAVEMAFMTMFLIILVTGIIDLGRAIYTNISVQEAAQEGAFYGGFEETVTKSDIVDRTVGSTGSITLDPADVVVTCNAITRGKRNAARVQVDVSYDLTLITPVVGQWLGGTLTLNKTAEAERFYTDCPA